MRAGDEGVGVTWTCSRERIQSDDGDVCSVPGCGVSFDDLGYLIDVTVLTSPGEEGYAEITQWFCQEHYEEIAPKLMALGFKSHNHHGTNLLDAENDCGGYGKCPHPVEYGPELVVPSEPMSGRAGNDWTREELRVAHQALNECINGVRELADDSDFRTRFGCSRDEARAVMSSIRTRYESMPLGPDTPVCEACNQPTPHTLPRRPTVNDDYTINVGPCCDPDLHETCEHG